MISPEKATGYRRPQRAAVVTVTDVAHLQFALRTGHPHEQQSPFFFQGIGIAQRAFMRQDVVFRGDRQTHWGNSSPLAACSVISVTRPASESH